MYYVQKLVQGTHLQCTYTICTRTSYIPVCMYFVYLVHMYMYIKVPVYSRAKSYEYILELPSDLYS